MKTVVDGRTWAVGDI